MAVVVPAAAVGSTIELLAAEGTPAWRIGEVVPAGTLGGARYAEGALAPAGR